MESLNKHRDYDYNRGVELILKNRRKKEKKEIRKKIIDFDKVFFIFKKEIHISFNIFIMKKN